MTETDITIAEEKTTAASVADDMAAVKARTASDGTVEGEVKDIKRIEKDLRADKYKVTVAMPFGDPVEYYFDIPDAWPDNRDAALASGYKFVRWVEHYGYTAESIGRMAEDDATVQVDVSGSMRSLVVPDRRLPRRTRLVRALTPVTAYRSQLCAAAIATSVFAMAGALMVTGVITGSPGAGFIAGITGGFVVGMVEFLVFGPLLGWL